MSFLHFQNADADSTKDERELLLFQPDENESDSDETADRHTDLNLQTALDDDKLQTKLLRLFYDANSMYEEQGVNSLFLALGFLEWYESPKSDKVRYAPLLLIPVELNRRTVNAKFRVGFLDEDVTTNLSLQAKLLTEFGLQLPDLPNLDDLIPADYFAAVEPIIADQERWRVHPDRMTLWFFSFAKFLMFRDLEPDVWPEGKGPADHPLVGGLLGEPVVFEPPLIGSDEPIGQHLDVRTLCHILDADSSQAAAIEEVRVGRNLVIQGPPGTGKSQSIANVIASAVRDRRTVLFVSEKLAALEVVKSRLDRVGLGDICLELHSRKANRRAVLDELDRTISLGKPADADIDQQADKLAMARDSLNRYVQQLHTPMESSGRTPYELIGTLNRLQSNGVTPFDCEMPDISSWTPTSVRQKQELLRDLSEHLAELGVPCDSAWWGIRRTEPLLPTDMRSLEHTLESIRNNVALVLGHASDLAGSLHIKRDSDSESFESVAKLARFAAKLQSVPEMDRGAFADPVWESDRAGIEQAIARGRDLQQLKVLLNGVVAPVAWNAEVAQTRIDLAASGKSILRWFNKSWRRANHTLRGILEQPVPKELDLQLQHLDQLMQAQACQAEIGANGQLGSIGRKGFGNLWYGRDSNWDMLSAIVDWEADCRRSKVPKTFRKIIGRWSETQTTDTLYRELRAIFQDTWNALKQLIDTLRVEPELAFKQAVTGDISLVTLLAILLKWQQALPELGRWVVFQRRVTHLHDMQLDALLPQVERGELDESSVDRIEFVYCEAALREILTQRDAIADFDGISHTRRVDEFRKLDEERIRLARNEVAAVHYDGLPARGSHGEVGIIASEVRKKRRHKSLRRLLADAGHAVQAIKPVFMMSPISVAQFLEPGVLDFDLMVIDEASQVRPVEALGAMLRCRQATIVGDNRQLPPTAFFDRVTGGDDADDGDSDEMAAGDVESILDLCLARSYPQRMLRWHYRSRHHSLIAVSNHEFYDDGLFVVPSPDRNGSGRGLEFRFVADGVYDRGKTRTNCREAQLVAQAMIVHAQRHSHMSIGVGAFSVAQRDAILDELELLRRAHPETEQFFSTRSEEPWFVKNLENIQGDERDVILISVGYGPDESGYLTMSFGPLSSKGGERRLNVLISRAKQRCVAFSSIRSEDIDLRRTNSQGAKALKSFLHYAETGILGVATPTDREADSEFEEQVAESIRGFGYEVDLQVGVAGFFIDLAVVDPNTPGRYLIGIECDGATYHSARWARDRDRLRQAVLEDHGWTLYRIWSTDWFHSREEQLRKLQAALKDQQLLSTVDVPHLELDPVDHPDVGGVVSPDSSAPIEREDDSEDSTGPLEAIEYEEAAFSVQHSSTEIHKLSPKQLAKTTTQIVCIEGPIHYEEVARRATTLWGLQRAGNRITEAVDRALAYALKAGQVVENDGFYTLLGQTVFSVRNRECATSKTLRKAEMLPPLELDSAIVSFVGAHISATPEETIIAVARMLGFRSTSKQVRSRIESRIDVLLTGGGLVEDGNVVRVPKQINVQGAD